MYVLVIINADDFSEFIPMCTIPTFSGGSVSCTDGSSMGDVGVGVECLIRCNSGFPPQLSSSITCGVSGQFDSDATFACRKDVDVLYRYTCTCVFDIKKLHIITV